MQDLNSLVTLNIRREGDIALHHTTRSQSRRQLRVVRPTANMRAHFNRTNMEPAISDSPPPASRARARFELIFASAWLAIGLFALPAAIYFVGVLMLGPYKPGAGLAQFYTDFFGDLAEPTLRAWILALGPLVLITLMRLIFWGVPARQRKTTAPVAPTPQEEPIRSAPKTRERVEPRVGSE
jgi:hypothetical protein